MRIFCDADGIFCDWTGSVHRAFGLEYDPLKWPYTLGPEGWHWHDEVDKSFMDCSAVCDYDFWVNALWTLDGNEILDVVKSFSENITLLTTPMPNVMSASGKIAWIEKNLPEFKKHILICTEAKDVLARVPDAILIDDSSCNVRDWRAAGGTAVIVPRWWNDAWPLALSAPSAVKLQLEIIKCQHPD